MLRDPRVELGLKERDQLVPEEVPPRLGGKVCGIGSVGDAAKAGFPFDFGTGDSQERTDPKGRTVRPNGCETAKVRSRQKAKQKRFGLIVPMVGQSDPVGADPVGDAFQRRQSEIPKDVLGGTSALGGVNPGHMELHGVSRGHALGDLGVPICFFATDAMVNMGGHKLRAPFSPNVPKQMQQNAGIDPSRNSHQNLSNRIFRRTFPDRSPNLPQDEPVRSRLSRNAPAR